MERAPNNAKAFCNRGYRAEQLGAHGSCDRRPDQSSPIGPRSTMAYGSRAIALIALDRRDEACQDLVQARERGDASMDETLVIYCL
ncbi:MAG: hypothetical protein IPH53_19395 [Flavobacteriales bacterium]|nr:hypothetical protein [Flavobacteriales bacterium]